MPKTLKKNLNKRKNLEKARIAKEQIKAPRKVEVGREVHGLERAAFAFLQGIVTILISRAKALSDHINPPDDSRAAVACHHIATIGSSQLYKLCQKSFGVDSIHQRIFYAGARSAGTYWEDIWAAQSSFVCDGVHYDIVQIYHEPYHFSHQLPWVGATPDFVALLKQKGKVPFWAVIEIKSYSNDAPTMPRYIYQVQVALDCFNINKGFLVVYDANIGADQQPEIQLLERSHLLTTKKALLCKQYNGFLQRCVRSLFATELPIETIETIMAPLSEIRINPFNMCWENLNKGIARKGCYYNKPSRLLGRSRRRFKKNVLKPSGMPHLLCNPVETQALVDEDGDAVHID